MVASTNVASARRAENFWRSPEVNGLTVTRPSRVKDLAWLAWLAAALFLTWPAMSWELKYVRRSSPGPFLVLLALSPLLLVGWRYARALFLKRHEFAVLAALPLIICIAYEPRASFVAMAVFTAGFCLGRRLIGALHIETRGPVEDIAFSVAMGLGLLHCALFVIGLAGGFVWWVFATLLAIPLLLFAREMAVLYRDLWRIDAAWANTTEARTWSATLLSASLLLFALTATIYALAPSIYFDILNLHLPAVRYYAAQHALAAPPALPYAYYPQSVETLMTLGYTLAGQPAAQLLPQIYFAIAMLLLIGMGRVSGMCRFSAVAGAAFALSIPVIHWTGSAGKNDLALAMFLSGSLLAFLRWRDTGQWGWILAGAFMIAMAAGVKHIVLFAIPPLIVLYGYAAWRQRKRARALLQVAGIVIVFGLFWHVRTWIATGNPVYPAVSATAVQGIRPYAQPSYLNGVVHRAIRFPWDLQFHGRRYYESVSDYPMGIALVLFAPVWLLVWKRLNAAAIIALSFSSAYLFYWAISVGMIRYAIAPIAIVYAFTACRLVSFANASTRLVRFSVFAACCYALLFSSLAIAIDEINTVQLRYFARQIDRPKYLREAMLPYRALEFVASHMTAGDAVLCVEGCAAAYLPVTAIAECFAVNEQTPWTEARAKLVRGPYRFAVVPRFFAADAPPGWTQKYHDESFSVLAR